MKIVFTCVFKESAKQNKSTNKSQLKIEEKGEVACSASEVEIITKCGEKAFFATPKKPRSKQIT